MSEEIKKVINGEYNNPELDASIKDLLYASMLKLDMSAYMCVRELRSNVITADLLLEDEYADENTLGL